MTGTVVYTLDPEFMSLLWTDPVGPYLMGAGSFLMMVGWVWARAIVNIRV